MCTHNHTLLLSDWRSCHSATPSACPICMSEPMLLGQQAHQVNTLALHKDFDCLRPNPTSPNPETPRESTNHLVTDCLMYYLGTVAVACLPAFFALVEDCLALIS
jgi:hypothetical protein